MKGKSLLALAVLANAGIAAASDLSYNFVQGSYQQTEIDVDGFSLDLDGFGVTGSAELGDMFFISASFDATSGDETLMDTRFDVDSDTTTLGLGFHSAINDKLDFVAGFAKSSADISVAVDGFGEFDGDADAYLYSVGLRGMAAESVELFANAIYVDADEGESDTAFNIGGQYYLTPALSIGMALQSADESDTTSLFARFSF